MGRIAICGGHRKNCGCLCAKYDTKSLYAYNPIIKKICGYYKQQKNMSYTDSFLLMMGYSHFHI